MYQLDIEYQIATNCVVSDHREFFSPIGARLFCRRLKKRKNFLLFVQRGIQPRLGHALTDVDEIQLNHLTLYRLGIIVYEWDAFNKKDTLIRFAVRSRLPI